MKKIIFILLAVVGVFAVYISRDFMDAARHGGSAAACERRLDAISKQQNIETVMMATKAGPRLRFTDVFQLSNLTRADVDAKVLASKAKVKLVEVYRTNPEAADFRNWEVELCAQYLDKNGSEVTTGAVTPKEL